MAGLYGGIRSIIGNLLPSLYDKVKKTEYKNPLDFGYDPSFVYKPPQAQKTMTMPTLLGRQQLNEGTQPAYEEPDYDELINKAAQYQINAGAERWFMKDLEQNKHEDAIAISISTFGVTGKRKDAVLSDINETIENMKAIENAKQQEDPTGEDVGANPLEEEMPREYRRGRNTGGSLLYNKRLGMAEGDFPYTEEQLTLSEMIKDSRIDSLEFGDILLANVREKIMRAQQGKEEPKIIQEEIDHLMEEFLKLKSQRQKKQEGGAIINEQMGELMPEEEVMPLETAEEPIETMLPDEDMEDNYLDFIIDEALDEEEEQYLLDRLNEDNQLSIIFDKVVEMASEFSGSGLIEGPGSAVSDSIPARLSDGEFVMTSKAANQIGPENLQGLMEVAELEAEQEEEGRRIVQAGGYVQEEDIEEEAIQPIVSEKVLPTGRILPESEVSKRAKANADILNPRMSLFAS